METTVFTITQAFIPTFGQASQASKQFRKGTQPKEGVNAFPTKWNQQPVNEQIN